jgi:glutamate synthase (ferredoxin)
MITLDLETGTFRENLEVKLDLATQQPYGKWLSEHRVVIPHMDFDKEVASAVPSDMETQLTAFGWSLEDVEMQVGDMADAGKETLFSLGEDTPLAVLSNKPHTLYDYFKQRFAQVTNPPIDPLREGIVMALDMALGTRHDLRDAPAESLAEQLRISSPVLNQAELDEVTKLRKVASISTIYPISTGPEGLQAAVKELCVAAEAAVRDGAEVVVLSDKQEGGVSPDDVYIPPLIAVGAVHHHLINAGLRLAASVVVETAQAWSTHHIACLVGFGASAVHPYLLFSTVKWQYDAAKRLKILPISRLLPSPPIPSHLISSHPISSQVRVGEALKDARVRPAQRHPPLARVQQRAQGPRGGRAQDPLQDRHLAPLLLPRRTGEQSSLGLT